MYWQGKVGVVVPSADGRFDGRKCKVIGGERDQPLECLALYLAHAFIAFITIKFFEKLGVVFSNRMVVLTIVFVWHILVENEA